MKQHSINFFFLMFNRLRHFSRRKNPKIAKLQKVYIILMQMINFHLTLNSQKLPYKILFKISNLKFLLHIPSKNFSNNLHPSTNPKNSSLEISDPPKHF